MCKIKQHILSNLEITDILIARDYDQGIREIAIRKFYTEIRVCNMCSKINNTSLEQREKTYKLGTKLIDSTVASARVFDHIEGSMLLDIMT